MFIEMLRESSACLLAVLPTTLIEQVALIGVLIAGLGTVGSTHMVSNVLCLILTFIGGAVLCLAHQAEFLAFLLPVVYIGAVVILFLFVVMMVDFRLAQDGEEHMKRTLGNMLWISVCTAGMGGFLWLFLGGLWPSSLVVDHQQLLANNVLAIGKVLYTVYLVPFEWVAVILLVAMVAALWLLSMHDEAHQKSTIPQRPKMRATDAVTYVDVPFRQGWLAT